MANNIKHLLSAAAMCTLAVATLCGCSDKKWHAEGSIAGGADTEIYVEAPNGRGGWYAIDTVKTDKNGRFDISGEPIGHPEVLRLTYGGQSLYFPIDSVESIVIEADASDFGGAYTLRGSESAEKLQAVNDMIATAINEKGVEAASNDPDLKLKLAEMVLRDPDGAVAYYTIFRKAGETLLFDPTQKSDLRIIGAVANAFSTNRPADPRTKFLETYYLSNRRNNGSLPGDTIVALEIRLPEIELRDNRGKMQSLTEVASKGNVVILNFTTYDADESPAFNIELAKVYDTYHDRGLEIYQVAFDSDEFQWRQSADNLPWVTVYNSPGAGDAALRNYNVTSLPTTFIINRNGELSERVANIDQIATTVARYM